MMSWKSVSWFSHSFLVSLCFVRQSGGLHAEISADKVNAAQVLGPFLTLFMIALEAGDPAWSFSGKRD